MNGKGCTHAHLALDFDAAIVPLDDLFGDGQSQAGALGFVLMLTDPVELFKEMGN